MATTSASTGAPVSWPLAVLAEALGGVVGGVLIGVALGAGIGWVLSLTPIAQQLGMGMLVVMVYAGLVGFVIGLAAGITLVGRAMRQGGSFWFALAGALVSAVVFSVVVRVWPGLFGDFLAAMTLVAGLTLVSALIGYNIRRGTV